MNHDNAITLDDIFKDAYENQIKSWAEQGMSNQEISDRIDKIDFSKLTKQLSTQATYDLLGFYKEHMNEIDADEQAKEAEFCEHLLQKWGKCFSASRTMYVIAVEIAESYSNETSKKDNANLSQKDYTFLALQHIHGRVCQEYLEVYYLLRLGFADGAYARWRSMYELCCIGQFIVNHGEPIAKQYYEQSQTEQRKYQWTNGAIDKDGKTLNIVNFDKLQDSLDLDKAWKEQYRLACFVNHGSPQGTFSRLANYKSDNIIPVGHSDYGLAMPAGDSALALAWASSLFFSVFPTVDSITHTALLGEWAKMIVDLYSETEKSLFPDEGEENDNEEEQ